MKHHDILLIKMSISKYQIKDKTSYVIFVTKAFKFLKNLTLKFTKKKNLVIFLREKNVCRKNRLSRAKFLKKWTCKSAVFTNLQ